jgi:sortase A
VAVVQQLKAPPGAPPAPPPVRAAVAALLTVSVLALWVMLYALVFSRMEADRDSSVLYAQLRENLSGATTPIGGVIKPGTPIALLDAPRAGLRDQVIVEGTAPSDLRAGPGHLRTSPLPGQPGVSVLFGRSLTFGGPFARVTALHPGDRLRVTTGQGSFVYVVDGVRHPGDPTPSLLAAGSSRLMLETTTGSAFGGPQTVFVDATIADAKTVVSAPPGRPTSVPRGELAMHGDSSAIVPLVLWLQGLVLVALGVVWARVRWGLWQAWIVGFPLGTAALWGASSTALLLTPNLV